MEGWRQRRPGSNPKPPGRKTKTDLTLTGLLMEGLGRKCLVLTMSARASNTSSGLRCLDKRQWTAVLTGESSNAGCVAAATEMEVAFF